MSTPLRALLFDVDGTLADTEELHRLAFNEAFAEFGLDWFWDRLRYRELLAVAGGRARMRAWAASRTPDRTEDPGFEALLGEVHRVKTRRYGELAASRGLPLRPGVARLIEEAAASGLALGIVTTTTAANVDVLLAPHFGQQWRERFATIVTGADVAATKPAPHLYVEALARLRLRPGAALAFEDSANGIRSARAADIDVIATPTWYSNAEPLPPTLATLPHLGDPDFPLSNEFPGAPWVDVACLRAWHANRGTRSVPNCEASPCC